MFFRGRDDQAASYSGMLQSFFVEMTVSLNNKFIASKKVEQLYLIYNFSSISVCSFTSIFSFFSRTHANFVMTFLVYSYGLLHFLFPALTFSHFSTRALPRLYYLYYLSTPSSDLHRQTAYFFLRLRNFYFRSLFQILYVFNFCFF